MFIFRFSFGYKNVDNSNTRQPNLQNTPYNCGAINSNPQNAARTVTQLSNVLCSQRRGQEVSFMKGKQG